MCNHLNKRIPYLLSVLALSVVSTVSGVNNVVFTNPTGDAATRLENVGRFNTTGLGNTPPVGRLSTELMTVINNKVYLSPSQLCFGDSRPAIPSGNPIIPGVLVIDGSNTRGNLPLAGYLPWSAIDPIANPMPQWQTSSMGAINSAHLNSGDVLVVGIDGDVCRPINGGGINGFELWDVSNPNPAKAKLLSFTQVFDVNSLLISNTGPNGEVIGHPIMFSQGKKDYLALTAGNLGRLKIYDITNPQNPNLIATWGSESLQFPGVDPSLANSTSTPSIDDFTNFINTLPPYLAFGFNVRGAFPGNAATDVNLIDKNTLSIGMANSGVAILDVSKLPKIKLISILKDLNDADRAKNVGGGFSVANANSKLLVEDAGSPPAFIKMNFKNNPNYVVLVSEFGFTPRIANAPYNGVLDSDYIVYVGNACTANAASMPVANLVAPTSQPKLAAFIRGACTFQEKMDNITAKGYIGGIMVNLYSNGEVSAGAAGTSATIPAVGISYYSGLTLFGLQGSFPVPPLFKNYTQVYPALPTSCAGNPTPCGTLATTGVTVNSGFIKATGLRVWDIKNITQPGLLSTIDTFCSANIADPSCQIPNTAFAAFEPVFLDSDTIAVSWETDGVLLIDLKNPRNPKQLAKWHPSDPAFEAQNGGAPLFSAQLIYDKPSGCLFVADVRGGLYVLDDAQKGPKCKLLRKNSHHSH